MKHLVQYILKILAKAILAKYQPEIIGITGSVGKTSAKEAIYVVLSSKLRVAKNIKNYNNEIGLPLSIIGNESPGKSLFGWLAVLVKAVKLMLVTDKNYPKVLILEMGADKPGDLEYLSAMISCQTVVITAIAPVHLEFFGSLDIIQKEKSVLVRKLQKTGCSILNNDDDRVREMAKFTKAKVLTYGFSAKSDVKAVELDYDLKALKAPGVHFKLSHTGSIVPVFMPKVIGQAGIYAALAGAAVGLSYKMNLVEISQALEKYIPPRGRLNLIAGIKETLIIDDSYNASPRSSLAALETLGKFSQDGRGYKYAVLGDMLELGSFTEEGHLLVGKAVFKIKIDKLIVVGERSRDIARGAKAAGMADDDIFHFADTKEAGLFIQDKLKPGDIILVKGSQGARMEKIVKEIMADPNRAGELLVRQDEEWLKH